MSEVEKGVIEIEYCPTMCQVCNKHLANTYVPKGSFVDWNIFVFCRKCFDKDKGCLRYE